MRNNSYVNIRNRESSPFLKKHIQIRGYCWSENLLKLESGHAVLRNQNRRERENFLVGCLNFQLCRLYHLFGSGRQGRSQGEGRGEFPPPPRNRKKCCRKMMLFPMALFLVTNFPKITKNSIFLLNSHQKFSKFSNNLCISSKREKINAGFVKFFLKNMLK